MPPKFVRKGSASGRANLNPNLPEDEEDASLVTAKRFADIARRAEMDAQMGFVPLSSGLRQGWMINMQSVLKLCVTFCPLNFRLLFRHPNGPLGRVPSNIISWQLMGVASKQA
jgi:hypothetical protein